MFKKLCDKKLCDLSYVNKAEKFSGKSKTLGIQNLNFVKVCKYLDRNF